MCLYVFVCVCMRAHLFTTQPPPPGEMTSPLAGGLPAPAVDSVNQWLAAVSPAARAANAQHIQRAMTAHAAAAEAAAVGVRTGGCDGGCGGCDGGSSRESSGARVPLLGLLMPNLHAVTVVVTGSHSECRLHAAREANGRGHCVWAKRVRELQRRRVWALCWGAVQLVLLFTPA